MIQRGAIERGVKFLNSRWEEDWYEYIDIERLDMLSGGNCIIGQLFGDYWSYPFKGGDRGSLNPREDRHLYGSYYGFYPMNCEEGERLTVRWKKEIRKLRYRQ
jgi:hypothetical protein